MRPASTLLVVRDGPDHIEVLMGRRSAAASFAPGAYVFPGGVVDDSDGDRRAVEAAGGVRDPWRVAAIRETYEETGALVAVDSRPFSPGKDFWLMAAAHEIKLQLSELAHISTWVTPAPLPRRYDTRFFLTRSRPAVLVPDGNELTEVRWVSPSRALAERSQGSFPAISPTVAHLGWLAEFATADEAWNGATEGAFAHLVDQEAVEGAQPPGLSRVL